MCKQELFVPVSSNLEVPTKISSNFIEIQTLESFPIFWFIIRFKSEEVPITKVVSYIKPFTAIFYFKFFKLGKVLFGSNKV
jgi:hypothetical protein